MSRDERADIRNERLGFVFQNFNLLNRTSALENVELPLLYRKGVSAKQRRAKATELLQQVAFDKFSEAIVGDSNHNFDRS